MKILALDTSGQAASVAVLEEDRIVGEYTIHYNMTHSQTIMPMIAQMLELIQQKVEDMDYIACTQGPGSFTGLRIGAATAKGLAYAHSIPVIPVPTLDVLAYNIFDTGKIICPIMDARRQQVYTAFYEWRGTSLSRLTEYEALPIEEVVVRARQYGKQVVFVGDGVAVYKEKLAEFDEFLCAPLGNNLQRAGCAAALAAQWINEGKEVAIDGKDFAPFYLRKSQAERELEEKNVAKEGNTYA
ncbi:MAG: tRNA (adenosine(37)-N6)-threonylcarbamoyltransferase complex dimerization subunit type 1 TsaB [Epulopiscium sp.]|jgi:tRNA threonylcarbamoyladenosine biosynthesis protein TsaB|nr:tRNA (adenosine(37)-N6)-threonylcarbamoyltransferase complex dimerization subunit type 1 TsaB [Candidatus Epulonipiscium sp.]